jgi:hypothetical protein
MHDAIHSHEIAWCRLIKVNVGSLPTVCIDELFLVLFER